jgi:hypothetical protein
MGGKIESILVHIPPNRSLYSNDIGDCLMLI